VRAKPGASTFYVLVDDSRSLGVRDDGQSQSRGEHLRALLAGASGWQVRLGQDFQTRRYTFGSRLRDVPDFESLTFQQPASQLHAALQSLAQRSRGPAAAAFATTPASQAQPGRMPAASGVLLFTDGNATDWPSGKVDLARLPPIFPVLVGSADAPRDVSVRQVTASTTNFEDAPVAVSAQIVASGYAGRPLVAELVDASGRVLQRLSLAAQADDRPVAVRFQHSAQPRGVEFLEVRAALASQADPLQPAAEATSAEAVLENNQALAVVTRPSQPHRVLYVSGRPNWEYKFLRRAIESDPQLQLVALIRIADREPKFDWRGRGDANPLFRGFDHADPDQVEQHDQPVVIRLGTRDADELRGGFPQKDEELFTYDALILDDLPADFLTADQMSLVQRFVSRRGGGLLMLGGQESLRQGDYQRTPVGETLPVYLDRQPPGSVAPPFRLQLTRDGWLQTWTRLRSSEAGEKSRLAAMPAFATLNRAAGVKPGAVVLSQVVDRAGQAQPALVVQSFGRGQVGALLVGDLWRWALRRDDAHPHDFEKAWRQTLRWLVSQVPPRVEIETAPAQHLAAAGVNIRVRARDPRFEPLDNALVTVTVRSRDGDEVKLTATAENEPGVYEASFVPPAPGGYSITAKVTAADRSHAGSAETGWVADPAANELASLAGNARLLEELAEATGGQVVAASALDRFVRQLPQHVTCITERHTWPLWQQPWVLALALALLVGEWGLRRWSGMA
jgi:uncharacterized membrane protein